MKLAYEGRALGLSVTVEHDGGLLQRRYLFTLDGEEEAIRLWDEGVVRWIGGPSPPT